MRPEPRSWLETSRGRRVAFVLALAPGPILLVAAVNVWTSPWLLALSLAWTAIVAWRLRGLVAGGSAAPSPPSPPSELKP
ncbi:hypothetical protein [Caulobacter sp. CCH5-E12]|uniref:hypothetical protein n=1 Tax=Caulobacter sp. CCH5-E12 TaxID=1768770 RepID=UPI0007829BE1|nr:hypothetical protein [Caulobacter sp. CCH5-E12]